MLQDAAHRYRLAATAAGVAWPERADGQGVPLPDLDLVHRLFDVDHVPEQLTWLLSQGWDRGMLFPGGGMLEPWPTRQTARASLDLLSASIGTPFHWRHQIPLFFFSTHVYTFVLEGTHEGEIWRYLGGPDAWDPVRAAPSLTALLTEWTKGIAAGVVYYSDVTRFLLVGDPTARETFDDLWRRFPDIDPFAFSDDIPAPLLRERQRASGVDLDCVDRGFECWEELLDDIDAVQASLGL
ncbi:hypothetical protein GCM10010532_082600 [Dactylosporangium siamense]|uniref:Uncharacterized protein n=1 Tax=Dactylosporangium siamense TaxID=685454 RepID=A0A919PQX9_9ACTN|nr:hypothetical protein Dsi01nite_061330 [Dactylosporangium siamense]